MDRAGCAFTVTSIMSRAEPKVTQNVSGIQICNALVVRRELVYAR